MNSLDCLPLSELALSEMRIACCMTSGVDFEFCCADAFSLLIVLGAQDLAKALTSLGGCETSFYFASGLNGIVGVVFSLL